MMPTPRLLQSALFFVLLTTVGAALTSPSMGAAQPSHETAIARSLFKEGVAFADAGDWMQAEDRFRRAHSLRPSPVIAFNWVSALEQLGRLLEASELARGIVKDPEADEDLVQAAREKREAIEPRLGGVTVAVTGSSLEGVHVLLDQRELPKAAWGVETPADPGEHTAEAQRDGATVAQASVSVAEGEKGLISLVLPDPQASVAQASVAEDAAAPSEPEPARRPLLKNPWLWAAVGAVVVGAVVAGSVAAASGGGTASPPSGNTSPPVLTF